MDFTFTDEQRMIADTVRELLADRCTGADLRRLMDSGEARDEARWQAIVEMGLTGLLVPESAGGLGLSEVDFVQIAEACGYFALPEPLVEQVVAAPLLAAFADKPQVAEVLADVVAGTKTIALAHPANPFVTDADRLLLVDGGALHLVDAAKATLTRRASIDPFRRLFTAEAPLGADTLIGDAGAASGPLAQAFERHALFAAAQGLGLAQKSIDLGAAYAKERTQFGKVIGGYQAVKHLLATAQVAVEFARPVVQAAAAQIGQDDVYARARVSHAKLAALSAATHAAETSIQVHGAMGYSWEVDVHFYLKRALALTGSYGDAAWHRARVMARLTDLPLGPDTTFAREAA